MHLLRLFENATDPIITQNNFFTYRLLYTSLRCFQQPSSALTLHHIQAPQRWPLPLEIIQNFCQRLQDTKTAHKQRNKMFSFFTRLAHLEKNLVHCSTRCRYKSLSRYCSLHPANMHAPQQKRKSFHVTSLATQLRRQENHHPPYKSNEETSNSSPVNDIIPYKQTQ